MSISEQVKELRNLSFALWINTPTSVMAKTALSKAADTIESLSAKLQEENVERSDPRLDNGWIYCGDGKNLPEKDGCYLCTNTFKEVSICGYGWNSNKTRKIFFIGGCPAVVVAWKPLPDPYYGENNNAYF